MQCRKVNVKDRRGGEFNGQLSNKRQELPFKTAFVQCAGMAPKDLALFEDDAGGHGSYIKTRRRALIFVDVNFQNTDLPVQFRGQLLNNGHHGLAGSAPIRVKIYKHSLIGLYDLIKSFHRYLIPVPSNSMPVHAH